MKVEDHKVGNSNLKSLKFMKLESLKKLRLEDFEIEDFEIEKIGKFEIDLTSNFSMTCEMKSMNGQPTHKPKTAQDESVKHPSRAGVIFDYALDWFPLVTIGWFSVECVLDDGGFIAICCGIVICVGLFAMGWFSPMRKWKRDKTNQQ